METMNGDAQFTRGKAALAQARWHEALTCFEVAIDLAHEEGFADPPPDYLSHYGLCLGLVGGRPADAIRACRRAVAQDRDDADLWRNLGRVLVAARRREEAFYAFQCGLDARPGDRAILRELARMGVRDRPVMPLLSRRNRLNVVLGKARRRLRAE